MSEPTLAVIPARLASERLPEKPLQPIAGRPLIEWVWRRVSGMGLFGEVVVATDSERIVDACRAIGARVVLTDPDHRSGTERVAEVARGPTFHDYPVIVNVQGDEPLVEALHLSKALALVRDEGWDLGTCATPVRTKADWRDPAVVKVVRAGSGAALYFSRATIPHRRDGEPSPGMLKAPPFLRHLGIYAYRREALLRWVALPPSPLEELERLEQLRALEGGLSIGVAVVEAAARGVDTAEDLARMEGILSGTSRPVPSETGAHD